MRRESIRLGDSIRNAVRFKFEILFSDKQSEPGHSQHPYRQHHGKARDGRFVIAWATKESITLPPTQYFS